MDEPSSSHRSDAQKLFEEKPYSECDSGSRDRLCPDGENEKLIGQRCCWPTCGVRWVTIILLVLGMSIVHAQRINVSVSLLAVYSYIGDKVGSDSARDHLPNTSWTAVEISILHSGFFAGYLITQIPAALASYRFTAHRAFVGGTFCTCALNFLLPVLIEKNLYSAVMVVRICQGLAEGFLWPAAYILVNNWSPMAEKRRISGFVTGGSYVGAIFGFPFCGFITHYIGWQYIYYGTAAAGVLWCIFWVALAYEKPDHHPKISETEQAYIRKGRPIQPNLTSWRDVPWKEMFMSRPFLALIACSFAKGWVFNLLLMQEPTYMHVFGYSIAQNGIWSALPFLLKLIVCSIGGYFADLLVNNGLTTSTNVRKIFNTLGFGTEALCLFSLSFIYSGTAAVVMLSIGVSMGGLAVSGWQTNHLDLAPQFAGILVGITQCCSNLAGIFSPLTAGYFIQESGKLAEAIGGQTGRHHVRDIVSNESNMDIYGWHMIFLVSSLIILVCCAFYIVCASGEEQAWAKSIKQALPEEDNDTRSHLNPIVSKISTKVSYQTINNATADTDSATEEVSQVTIEQDVNSHPPQEGE